MRVILSVAVSLDGYIDSSCESRLRLSSAEDFYDVHSLRSECDAVMVGANTIRKDDPSLVTRHAALLESRRGRGLSDDPVKVTVTRSGDLPSRSRFFQKGSGDKWIFSGASATASHDFGDNVRFFSLPDDGLAGVLRILRAESIGVLLVEGGTSLLTQFLRLRLAHHLRLAVAPFFVGDAGAPRFVDSAMFPYDEHRRMRLLSVRVLGDMAVMDYDLE